jgi:hypothetical protein
MGTDVLEVQSEGVYYLNGVAGAELPTSSRIRLSHTHPTALLKINLGGSVYQDPQDFVSVVDCVWGREAELW